MCPIIETFGTTIVPVHFAYRAYFAYQAYFAYHSYFAYQSLFAYHAYFAYHGYFVIKRPGGRFLKDYDKKKQ